MACVRGTKEKRRGPTPPKFLEFFLVPQEQFVVLFHFSRKAGVGDLDPLTRKAGFAGCVCMYVCVCVCVCVCVVVLSVRSELYEGKSNFAIHKDRLRRKREW